MREARILADRYRIAATLGRGAGGELLRAEDIWCEGAAVAIKLQDVPPTQSQARALEHEFRLLRELDHPYAVRALEFGKLADGRAYFSMELLAGKEINRAWTRLPAADRFALLLQICEILQSIHAHGHVHGDVRPENIIVRTQVPPAIGLLGFGHAAPIGSNGAVLRTTPAYAAPEVLADAEVGIQADLYALGILLHRLFSGRLLFGEGAAARRHVEAAPRELPGIWRRSPPAGLTPHAGSLLAKLIGALLAKEPRQRPATAAAVAGGLADVRRSLRSGGGRRRPGPSRTAAVDPRPPFVGRTAARESLGKALERMLASQRPLVVHLRGPGGIGKARLLDAVRTDCALRGVRTIETPCAQDAQAAEGARAGLIVGRLIERLARALPPDREVLEACGAELLRTAPGLADHAATRTWATRLRAENPLARALPPRADHIRRWDRISEFLVLQASRHPLWLTFRDAESGGEELPALIAALSRREGGVPILFCLTSAAEEPPPWLRRPEALGVETCELALGGLNREETGVLLRSLVTPEGLLVTGCDEPPLTVTRDLVRRLHPLTQGSPRRILELARRMVARDTDNLQKAEVDEVTLTEAPASLLAARLRELGPAGTRMLFCVAHETDPVPEKVLAGAWQRWAEGRRRGVEGGAAAVLEELRATRWLVSRRTPDETRWALRDERHAALLRALTRPAERRSIHSDLGTAWERRIRAARDDEPPVAALSGLARHLLQGGEPEKGVQVGLRAARELRRLRADRPAFELLAVCLPAAQRLARSSDTQRRREIEVLLELGDLAHLLRDTAGEAQILKRLQSRACHPHLQPVERAHVLRRHGEAAHLAGRRAAAVRALRRADRLLGQGALRSLEALAERLRLAEAWAKLHIQEGAPEKALAVCREALRRLESVDADVRVARLGREAAALLHQAAVAQLRSDQPSEALRSWARALSTLRLAGDGSGMAEVLSALGRFHVDRGNVRRARGALSRTIAQRRGLRDFDGVTDALESLVLIELMSGHPSQARRIIETVQRMRRRAGDRLGEMLAVAALGETERMAGSYGRAEEQLSAAVSFLTDAGETSRARGPRTSLAAVWLATGRRAKAEHALRQLLREMEAAVDPALWGLVKLQLGDCALERHREHEACDPFVAARESSAEQPRRRDRAARWLQRARAEYAAALTVFRDRAHRYYHGLTIVRVLETHLASLAQSAADPLPAARLHPARLPPEQAAGYFQALGRTASELGSAALEAQNLLMRGSDRLLTALASTGQTRGESLSIARSLFRDAQAIARQNGLREALWQIQLGQARASRLAGRYRRAHNHLRKALDLLHEMQREVRGAELQRTFLHCAGRQAVLNEVELLAAAAGLRLR